MESATRVHRELIMTSQCCKSPAKLRNNKSSNRIRYPLTVRILVMEDEKRVARFIRRALAEGGFAVELCRDGNEALSLIGGTRFDAIILDAMLPGSDGLNVLKRLRSRSISTPVLMLTGRGSVNERVETLSVGADDYLSKPFSTYELAARTRALVRRSSSEPASFHRIADLIVRPAERTVERSARRIDLTSREFALLDLLVRHSGRVFTRTEICERFWDYDFDPGTNVVDTCIRRLREKIDDPFTQKLIHTVRSTGYKVAETT
jgi:DNA-binding response OmpR family regulator